MSRSRYAQDLRELEFDQITGLHGKDRRTAHKSLPYFVRGSGNVLVTFAFDEFGDMWVVSKLVDLSFLGFYEKQEDVGPLLKRLNELAGKQREIKERDEERKRRTWYQGNKRQHQ